LENINRRTALKPYYKEIAHSEVAMSNVLDFNFTIFENYRVNMSYLCSVNYI